MRIAAKDVARSCTNPAYVEALELAVRVLENNQWTMPKRRTERIRGGLPHVGVRESSLVSGCCDALVLLGDAGGYECSKCQQPCTASRTLSEAYSDECAVKGGE